MRNKSMKTSLLLLVVFFAGCSPGVQALGVQMLGVQTPTEKPPAPTKTYTVIAQSGDRFEGLRFVKHSGGGDLFVDRSGSRHFFLGAHSIHDEPVPAEAESR